MPLFWVVSSMMLGVVLMVMVFMFSVSYFSIGEINGFESKSSIFFLWW